MISEAYVRLWREGADFGLPIAQTLPHIAGDLFYLAKHLKSAPGGSHVTHRNSLGLLILAGWMSVAAIGCSSQSDLSKLQKPAVAFLKENKGKSKFRTEISALDPLTGNTDTDKRTFKFK